MAVASGGTFLGNPVAQGDVLCLALEDSERRLRDRGEKLLGPFATWPARGRYETDWPRGDEAVAAIRKWLEGGDVFDVMSGTLGLNGCADTLLIFHQDAQGMTLHCRGRDVEELSHGVEFDRPSCKWKVLGDADEVHKSDQRKAIVAALRDAGQSMGPTDLAAVTGTDSDNVRKLLFKMAKDGQVRRVGHGRYVPGYVGDIGDIGSQPIGNTTEPMSPRPGDIRPGPATFDQERPLPPPPMPRRP